MRRFWVVMLALVFCATPAWAATKTFTWTASVTDSTHDAPTSYTVKCGNAAGGPYPTLIPVSGSPLPTTVVWTIAAPGTWFCVVTASNIFGESGASNEVTFRYAPPSAPSGLTVQ